MGVEIRPVVDVPDRLSLPMPSGRIVTFDKEHPTVCVDSDDMAMGNKYVEVIGPCKQQPEINKYSPQRPRGKCKKCGNKKGAHMRCDLIVKGDKKVCIRCKGEARRIATYRSCDRPGLGDRLMRLFTKWGFTHCEACSRRRLWLNELDRTIYRKVWGWFHGI